MEKFFLIGPGERLSQSFYKETEFVIIGKKVCLSLTGFYQREDPWGEAVSVRQYVEGGWTEYQKTYSLEGKYLEDIEKEILDRCNIFYSVLEDIEKESVISKTLKALLASDVWSKHYKKHPAFIRSLCIGLRGPTKRQVEKRDFDNKVQKIYEFENKELCQQEIMYRLFSGPGLSAIFDDQTPSVLSEKYKYINIMNEELKDSRRTKEKLLLILSKLEELLAELEGIFPLYSMYTYFCQKDIIFLKKEIKIKEIQDRVVKGLE